MTSKLTRERIELIANFHRAMALPPSHAENEELARMALAAMDSEPVALQPELAKVIYHFRDWNEGFPVERFKADYVISWMLANYPPAQPAPVVSAELLHTAASAIEDLLTTKDRTGACVWFDLPFRLRSAANAQPAPVVPDAATAIRACLSEFPESARDIVEECADIAENACRAAMLQASPVCTCPSGDGSLRWPCPVHPGNSPAQSDCCPAQNSVNPAQGGNYLVIPDEMTSEQAYEIGYYYGDPVDVFARGANWMRQHIIDSTLAAAPQSPGSEPATVPGKWIPVSERMPERGDYLVTDGCDFDVQLFNGEQFIPGFVWEDKITHWMPLPAAPQEVKGE
ncbi:Eaa1 [Klebsiella pneumoniae]|nr:hypothetical protein SM88_00523 [Klebsiella pneumoniae]OUH48026.1 hypothetical protein AZ026_004266 [Klebsiella pneumoniae]CAA0230618.1 Uncharacterised protein [Klebsiella pneumoniae]SAR25102.1 Eaa1 [Klebsiella pneumoniae]SAR40620.1 Eaa1 [Klebsiella pneumoniae]